MIELRGIAWNHSRGFTSVVATAQRFEELHPGVRITWEKRSLQAFADAPMDRLAADYDLIVMDHPHTAIAAESGVLLPLDEWLPAEFLGDQSRNSVGRSHDSYSHLGHQWTLATDAAAPVATWRRDLMDAHGLPLPATWEDVLALARAGHVAVSLFPVDVLMHVYMFCEALGTPAFAADGEFAPADSVAAALECLKELGELCGPESFERNPILTAEFMTRDDAAAYCPFAYGYSNYSRPRYARKVLKAGGLVSFRGRRLRSTLGGAGLAVSSKTAHRQVAADYARFTAEAETQRGIYFEAGGQPGYRGAWTDDGVNAASNNFFKDTLATLDEAIVRPRYAGYMHFQDAASPVAHAFVAGKSSLKSTLDDLGRIYRDSLQVPS
ncbi:MAG: extracellular solute-binding protein [Chthoniobacterales bacterium]|nr:extracellular solute-binding protein [Chthoniobacterales bacterium]